MYQGNVEPNSFYPTIESMYTIFLGLHDKSSLDRDGTYSPPTVKMNVSKVVVVNNANIFLKHFLYLGRTFGYR